jgi:hypothetical protein
MVAGAAAPFDKIATAPPESHRNLHCDALCGSDGKTGPGED